MRGFEESMSYADRIREQQRFHGERVEARQAERGNGKDTSIGDAAAILADIAIAAIIGDIVSTHRQIEAQSPFLKFWGRLNAKLEINGKPEAMYGAAREAFLGGPTPVGALTFIGKEFDGTRAIPGPGGSFAYAGEYRMTDGEGAIVWHKVRDNDQRPVPFSTPEAALNAARGHQKHRLAQETNNS